MELEAFSQMGLCRSLDEYERLPIAVLEDARWVLWTRDKAREHAEFMAKVKPHG
jgi:hypothetical protein